MTKTAFIFPGQGSQYLGMGKDLAEQFPIIDQTLNDASDSLDLDLKSLMFEGPDSELNRTDNTQPAILALSVAIYRQLSSIKQPSIQLMAGHSLGEYSALVCAGVIDFSDALNLVALRGRLMLEAVPEGTGAMAAILGLEDSTIEDCCQGAAGAEVVSAVNYNSPGQVVIAGHKAAVERASQACIDAGAKRAIPLAVSVPSHCALMKPAAEKLAAALTEVSFNEPQFSVLNNTDVAKETQPEQIRAALIKQLYSPVRWSETIQSMLSDDIECFVECGPSKVLAGLNKRIDRRSKVLVTTDVSALNTTMEFFNHD